MSISTTTNQYIYTGNGSTRVFAFGSKFFTGSDVKVYLDGVLQTTGYGVSGAGVDAGGSVTFATAPASGVQVALIRAVPYTQGFEPQDGAPIPSRNLENSVDRAVVLATQALERASRSPAVTPFVTGITDMVLPAPVDGKTLVWDGTTGKMKNSTGNVDEAVADATAQAVIATTQAGIATTKAGEAAADRVQTGLDRAAAAASAASIDPATLAKTDLSNALLVSRSESSSFTIGKADNNKTILVTAAATVTEAAGADACVAGNVIHINNTGTKAGGYLVTVSLTIDGVSGRVLVGGESLTLLALGSGAFRTIAEHIEPWSFWGYNSTARTNNSGDNTEDYIECDTVVHNIGGQLSGRFHTTMASCVCSYAVSISLANLASNHTRLVVTLKRSNGDVIMDYSNPYAQMEPGDTNLSKNYCSPKVDQDSGDTASCRYKVVGGSKVVTLNAGKDCGFSGEFIRSLT